MGSDRYFLLVSTSRISHSNRSEKARRSHRISASGAHTHEVASPTADRIRRYDSQSMAYPIMNVQTPKNASMPVDVV